MRVRATFWLWLLLAAVALNLATVERAAAVVADKVRQLCLQFPLYDALS